jgi:hypothetical protein
MEPVLSGTAVVIVTYFYLLLIPALALALWFLYRAEHNIKSALFFSVSAPGAIAWVIVYALYLIGGSSLGGPLRILLAFPASWILPVVCVYQYFKLRRPIEPMTGRDVLTGFSLIGLYFVTWAVARVAEVKGIPWAMAIGITLSLLSIAFIIYRVMSHRRRLRSVA